MSYNKKPSTKMSQDKFINIANALHNSCYDYSKTVYVNSKTKITVTCPIHGDFLISPSHHINRGQGCKYCKTRIKSPNEHKSDLLLFVKERGYKVLSCPDSLNSRSIIKIECKCEDNIIESTLYKILNGNSKGCRQCMARSFAKSDREWADLFKLKWGNRYNYDSFTSLGANKVCTVTCKVHGDFSTTPSKHKLRSGCPSCANIESKFDNITIAERNKDSYKKQPCSLYFLKLEGGKYKFGISKNLKDRIKKLNKTHGSIDVIATIETDRYEAIILEKFFLNLIKNQIIGGRDLSEVFAGSIEDELLLTSLILYMNNKRHLKS